MRNSLVTIYYCGLLCLGALSLRADRGAGYSLASRLLVALCIGVLWPMLLLGYLASRLRPSR